MLMAAGTGSQSSARALPSWAKAPSRCRLMIRSPGLKRVTPTPTATTSPAPSLPGMKGGSGRNWYLPASINTSTYCTPRAAIFTCTSPAPGDGGSGSSRRCSTSGPPNASQTTAFMRFALLYHPTCRGRGRYSDGAMARNGVRPARQPGRNDLTIDMPRPDRHAEAGLTPAAGQTITRGLTISPDAGWGGLPWVVAIA